MLNDIENKVKMISNDQELIQSDPISCPQLNCVNWASRVKFLLSSLDFYEVCVKQGVGNKSAFLWALK